MKEKIAKINFNKGGGTSVNGVTPKLSIPKAWVDELGITQDNNVVKLTLEENKIIIEKEKEMVYEVKTFEKEKGNKHEYYLVCQDGMFIVTDNKKGYNVLLTIKAYNYEQAKSLFNSIKG